MKRIVFLGPQGAGKGTIASRVSAELQIPHISTGDMFRDAIKAQTKTGMLAKKLIDDGKLMPDEITNELVKERVAKEDCKKGFMLDGFPRNTKQAEALDTFAKPDHVIALEIPEKVSIDRLSGRQQCKKCKKIYQIKLIPPKKAGICDACGAELFIRDDDRPEAIKERLRIYQKETQPLLDFYKRKRVLHVIDASREVEPILRDTLKILR
jgi:adenylate kinase